MATLILSAVGMAVAGPFGAAVGAVAGQQIDQKLFGPKGRDGARLADLAVQNSTYGAAIPHIFGTMRVAGSVIWATDLKEERRTTSQGKGQPKATTYSYSLSFAVALSARQGVRLGRIWADGKLLRGAAGDFKVATGFRFHDGREDAAVDPLIAAAEGAAATPAYRGLCYAVFEDMAVESFGNRIPNLSFELIADEGPVSAGAIMAELAGPAVQAEASAVLEGFAAQGETLGSAIAPLVQLFGLMVRDEGRHVRIARAAAPDRVLSASELGAAPGTMGTQARIRKSQAAANQPSAFRLAYADPARDYQLGEQRVDLFANGQSLSRDLAGAVSANTARTWALDAVMDARAAGDVAEASLGWHALALWHTDSVMLPDSRAGWQIQSMSFEAMRVTLSARRMVDPAPDLGRADGGRAVTAPDIIHGTTQMQIVELPWLEAGLASRPALYVAAAGAQPGWRRASLMFTSDGGARWSEIGETAAPAVLGTCLIPPGPALAHALDRRSVVEIALAHDGMTLSSCEEDALLGGRNLLRLGDELLQFATAERIGPARYRLTRLLRGRRGTEAAIAGHQPGEEVLLIETDTLVPLPIEPSVAQVEVAASGLGDGTPVRKARAVTGLAVRPLSPVHLRVTRQADGSMTLRWVRRSRHGWDWPDGTDTPLGEERALFHLRCTPDVGASWDQETSATELLLPATLLAQWRTNGATRLVWAVRQIGNAGVSLASQSSLLL